MNDPSAQDLTLALERRLVNAWPSFEVELAEGWLLRFAEGYSRRANSATPMMPGAGLDPDLMTWVAAAFEARGLSPCYRLTGLEAPDCAERLAGAGFAEGDASLTMLARLGEAGETDPALRIEAAAKPAWIKAASFSYGGEKADGDKLGRIVRRIRQPAAFATLSVDGQPAAWGLAVAERGLLGLYDIVVDPTLRGLGLGRRLVGGLIGWGVRTEGVSGAYLQVRESNEAATTLYRSLGFETAYRYRQFVAPNP